MGSITFFLKDLLSKKEWCGEKTAETYGEFFLPRERAQRKIGLRALKLLFVHFTCI
jgi:hypothetical protein